MTTPSPASVYERLRRYDAALAGNNELKVGPNSLRDAITEAADLLEQAVRVLSDHQAWACSYSFQEYKGSSHEEDLKELIALIQGTRP